MKPMFGLLVLVWTVSMFFACTENKETGGLFKLDEAGPEYTALAYAHMKKFLAADPVDSVKIDGAKMYINVTKEMPDSLYKELARRAALELNKFKQKKLGYTGITVICVNDNGAVAHALVP
ncbi:MAG: hypothetical protein A2487_16060 [Candidatus Raymondbacteria bacterium RifOxyC12_full_50_8]|uniref:Uncharacterized protein n=1 Tax=Candidatus Raymondbacteria bacterium RIFOXYD12_FULL_49_13 TaxID=1817890 RepID=A0A1F7FEW6_UNCRA|nr:MAG: hypothetical protein A2248_10270 [Candidatus Raymondbacteria bacterium RIFOXYA2_FULL_49_16]OGJ99623.1 MAG: hypothetical protein A2487_16060 [Candidatus Raymondbacteria bacterium RifOxyC12_full_50_8]OGK05239.1 MAG: hypothetical protein A2519_10415 [Candidatus Raymondbacteria bacterium RIFOXYD12_FULL_49_13]OGP43024.1 MAG: hypothetical protein A2324_14955 [Candidatus Raymondbacteria bacterium RIFOXYB2_FULL_49_35]